MAELLILAVKIILDLLKLSVQRQNIKSLNWKHVRIPFFLVRLLKGNSRVKMKLFCIVDPSIFVNSFH